MLCTKKKPSVSLQKEEHQRAEHSNQDTPSRTVVCLKYCINSVVREQSLFLIARVVLDWIQSHLLIGLVWMEHTTRMISITDRMRGPS